MKILHVEAGRHMYGGVRQVLYLLAGMRDRGIVNVLVCPERSAIIAQAQIHAARVYPIPMRGDLDVVLVSRLRSLIRRECPDLIHVHSRRGADVLGGMAARWSGVKTILSRRVDNRETVLTRWKYLLYDKVITISEAIRHVLVSEGVPTRKLVCVRSAIDATEIDCACDRGWFGASFGFEPKHRVIGIVAQLIERKGHAVLLAAMPEVLRAHPDTRLLIMGRGPLREQIAADIERRGIGREVLMTGFRNDLRRILPCLDLVVHPAAQEGLGVALLEASAASVPIVASNSGGIPEIVRDGETGILVRYGDPHALARAISALLDDPAASARMGAAGRLLAEGEFSVEQMVAGHLAVYRELHPAC